MENTSKSLLERLKEADQQDSWARFARLYTPLLHIWAQRLGLDNHDAADLIQDVFVTVLQKMPEFHWQRVGCFRKWLHTILVNRYRARLRKRTVPVEAGAAAADHAECAEPCEMEEAEYRRRLVGRALELMQRDFSPKTWRACWEHEVKGRPAAEVAAELGISTGSVYVAKARVLRRLRTELQGLLD